MNDSEISMPAAKVVSLWAVIGITSWTQAAAFAGFVYSCLLIGEWIWKKAGRPFAERRGWVSSRQRGTTDFGGLR
jgi:hypothetical protein